MEVEHRCRRSYSICMDNGRQDGPAGRKGRSKIFYTVDFTCIYPSFKRIISDLTCQGQSIEHALR